MDKNKVYLTKEGLTKIQKELNDLRNVTRPNAVSRLSLARIQGDLMENNEYASAKEELAFIDGRIEELEEVLKKVELIDEGHVGCQAIALGCKVTVLADKEEHTYHIVGEWEANPVQKKISPSSPLGQALLGKKVGDNIEFEAPAGKIIYKIIKID